ncbi:MAG: hypothetical protein JRN27_05000 [Nitrososphaerota archaeon]|nr:hypothetical protein [Nitrososphaerota archaeon]MDG6973376.1 hypothetical protein [Nitrososphaerota archaeon]MDG6975428.1 hypothetical protein [Nitrososphaerota archaeon]
MAGISGGLKLREMAHSVPVVKVVHPWPKVRAGAITGTPSNDTDSTLRSVPP